MFDKDWLTVANLFRHACDLRHLGRAKVLAVRDLIQTYDLPAKVVPHEQDVIKGTEDFWGIMGEIDLVLCATDNVPSRKLVNYVCVHTGTPLIMACTFHNARIGEIIRVLPGQSACYECTRLALHEVGALESVEDDDAPVAYGPMEEHTSQSSSQGSRADVAMVAALQARVTIVTLLADALGRDVLPRHYMAWGSVAQDGFPEPFAFRYPFSVNWYSLNAERTALSVVRLDCPSILIPMQSMRQLWHVFKRRRRTKIKAIPRLVINAGVRALIEREASSSLKVETGGILMGHIYPPATVHVTHASGPGPGAQRTPVTFLRDTHFCASIMSVWAWTMSANGIAMQCLFGSRQSAIFKP